MNTCKAQSTIRISAKGALLALGLAVLLGIVLVLLSACDDSSTRSSRPREVQILDKIFVVPAEWKYYRLMPNSEIGPYRQLHFTLDINTFEPVRPIFKKEHTSNLHIEIGSLLSEPVYWTERDPVNKTTPYNCSTHEYGGMEYEFCEHGRKVRLTRYGATDNYSIRDKKSGEYIAMIGCMDAEAHSESASPMCTGRTRILDNIQVRYGYKIQNFYRAVELDHKIREVALGLLKPDEQHSTKGDRQ